MAQLESGKSLEGAPPAEAALRASAQPVQVLGRVALVALATVLALYFASKGISLLRDYEDIIRTAYEAEGPPKFPEAGDITVFYTAGRVVVSEERSRLYDPDYFVPEVFETQGWQKGDPLAGDGAWSRFYNPPVFALLLSPLALLDVHAAYLLVLAVNLAAAAGLVYLTGRILRWQQPATVLLAMALFSYTPAYFVFQHAQPSLLLAVVLAGGFLLARSGAHGPGALLVVLAGLKPQWLLLPAVAAARLERRALLWSAAGAVLLIGLPFALVGVDGTLDYVEITFDRGSGDLSDQTFSSAILSWSGFFRALTGSPQPVLWLLAAGVSLGVFALVWRDGNPELTAAAAILTTLLVVPHSHPQDWVVVLVVAAIALSRDAPAVSHLVVGACLLGIHVAANDWPNASDAVARGQHAVYWVTLGGGLLLILLALLPRFEARYTRPACTEPAGPPFRSS